MRKVRNLAKALVGNRHNVGSAVCSATYSRALHNCLVGSDQSHSQGAQGARVYAGATKSMLFRAKCLRSFGDRNKSHSLPATEVPYRRWTFGWAQVILPCSYSSMPCK